MIIELIESFLINKINYFFADYNVDGEDDYKKNEIECFFYQSLSTEFNPANAIKNTAIKIIRIAVFVPKNSNSI